MSFAWPFGATSASTTPSEGEEEVPSTAREARQSRRDQLRSESDDLLQVPPPVGPRGIRLPQQQRSTSPADLLRNYIARRSPSPSPTPSTTRAFNFDIMDADQLERILTAALSAANANNAENNRAIVEAAVNAAASNNVAAQQSMRRPALPPFDPKDIENWLRRVEAAFDRLSITSPKVKLANLDEKLTSSGDANINKLLCSAPNQENYNALVDYLKKKHGRTIEQKAASVIEGTEREGRTPSQLLSVIKEKADNVTLDDIFKEQLLRRLPASIRMHLTSQMDGKTAEEVATAADAYFDPEGRVKNKTNATDVNSLQAPRQLPPALKQPRQHTPEPPASGFSTPFDEDDDADVNAVRFRQGQRQNVHVNNSGGGRNRSQSRGRYNSSMGSNGTSRGRYNNNSRYGNASSNGPSTLKPDNKVCFYHSKFGDKANRCEEHCILFKQFQAGKGKASQ